MFKQTFGLIDEDCFVKYRNKSVERTNFEINHESNIRNNNEGEFSVEERTYELLGNLNIEGKKVISRSIENEISPDRYLTQEKRSQITCSSSTTTSPSTYKVNKEKNMNHCYTCKTSKPNLNNKNSIVAKCTECFVGFNLELNNISSADINKKEHNSGFSLTEGKFRREGLIPACKGSIHTDYIIDSRRIGKGTYGSVRCGTSRLTGCVRAIKTIPLNRVEALDNFMKEINILKNLDHPNIVKLYETYQDSENIYLVMELCSGGELFDRIINQGSFDEVYAAHLMKQVLSTICYCHDHGIVHRDLKPENFLFLNNKYGAPLKIIDFGLAARINNEGTSLNTRAGTPYYVAPEVLQGKYDKQCDMWSLGVILYILLCGYPPFHGSNDNIILHKVQKGLYTFKESDWKHVSFLAIDLIKKLLTYNPMERITARDALNHPWITKFTEDILLLPPRNFIYCNDCSERDLITFEDKNINGYILRNSEGQLKHNGCTFSSERSYCIKKGVRYYRSKRRSISSSSGLNLLSNFRAFHKYNRFMKVALTVIAQQMTESQISNLKEAFFLLDANCDGTLTPQEIIMGLRNSGITEFPPDLLAILNDIDSDGSGSIDYTEFIAATLDSKQYSQEPVYWAAFKVFDQDGNGKITANELLNVFCCNSQETNSKSINDKALSDVKNMIKEVDVNGDGEIDFQEFLEMFKRSVK